jgi:hypothetical protein
MLFMASALLFTVVLCGATLGLLELGRRMGRAQLLRGEALPAGLGALEGAVFGLMGLLVAFSFNGAAQRLDARRLLIVQEANAIGTAWLRLDLLPAEAQPALRDDFRRYLDHRLAAFHAIPDMRAVNAHLDSVGTLQADIWRRALAAAPPTAGSTPTMLLLPALNEMFDVATSRNFSATMHPPSAIWVLLAVLTLACALLAGYDMAANPARSWMHAGAFAALLAASLLVIVDLEFPRVGLIRIDAFDQVLTALRASMG